MQPGLKTEAQASAQPGGTLRTQDGKSGRQHHNEVSSGKKTAVEEGWLLGQVLGLTGQQLTEEGKPGR